MRASGADRVKAHRLRGKIAKGEELDVNDSAFLDSYDESTKATAKGRSASERKVHLEIEERAAAEGDHPHPESFALLARAEGLRADTLLRITADALVRANDQYMRLCEHLLARTTAIEDAHVEMLHAVREHFLARVDAEADAKEAERAAIAAVTGDAESSEFKMMLDFLAQARSANKGRAGKGKAKGVKARKRARKERPLGAIPSDPPK